MDKDRIWILLITACALFSYLTIVLGYFPYLGIATSLITLSSLVFFFKKNKSIFNLILYILTLVFSFFIVYNSNLFLTFLNILAVLLLGSLIALPKSELNLGFLQFLISPITVFFEAFETPSDYKFKLSLKTNTQTYVEIGKSLLISVIILLVILPLLASANPFFNKLVADVIEIFNLRILLENLFSANYFVWLIRAFVFAILTLFVPRLITFINNSTVKQLSITNPLSSVDLFLPKFLVCLIIFIFFITQTQLYFASPETLQALGYSHSAYAREVFGQLSIVALVILGLIYNDKSKKKLSIMLSYFLVFEGIFLTFIALKSDYDYSLNWGFTYKRLWGFTGVFGILGIFVLYIQKCAEFVKGVILLISLLLIGVNIANFDYLIFHHRKSTTHSGTDYLYLSGLSSDSQSYGELLSMLEKIKQTNNLATRRVLTKINKLQKKYRQLDLRTFNFSEYLQYQKIKSIDAKYSSYITNLK